MLLCPFEDDHVENLHPFTRTRAAYGLRAGRRTILDTLVEGFGTDRVVMHCRPELAHVVREETGRPANRVAAGVDVLFVNGRILLHAPFALTPVRRVIGSAEPRVFTSGDAVAAAWIPSSQRPDRIVAARTISAELFEGVASEILGGVTLLDRIWSLLDYIGPAIDADFEALSKGFNIFERPGALISDRADLIGAERIYVAPGGVIRSGAVLDASTGPIIIGEKTEVMEHAVLHGPVSVGEHCIVKPGAVVEASTIGPWCKVAGEVHHSVMHSFSNKSHAGFLGHSYLGSWCNLGAHTNTSDLKNDYGTVSVYNAAAGTMEKTGGIFAGLFMGDHSKCGIDTMFNTGTVVGVSCNLFGSGYQPRYVPSFLWGGPDPGYMPYRLEKALHVADVVMRRRNRELSPAMRELLASIHEVTAAERERGVVM